MVALPGRTQAAFTAAELDPLLHERTQLKYFSTGMKHMENVVVMPQGGFRLRNGLRDIGALPVNASRIFTFNSSVGTSFDIVMAGDQAQAWGASSNTATFAVSGMGTYLDELTSAQQFDTLILFHEELKTKRIKLTDGGWVVDDVPFEAIPNYDYGATYTNGVPAVWRMEFVGLDASTVFVLTVSGQETQSIAYSGSIASAIQTAINDLPNVDAGIVVASGGGNIFNITFSGDGNEGDGWAVSGRVVNKADAAVLASKTTVGVSPGEPLISAAKGWPQCGAFYGQRFLVGGFKSLPNAWMCSKVADYFNFDDRFTEANGPFLIPMDVEGGEQIERIVPSLNLLIFTSRAEYWIAERALSKTQAPNHVQASRHGQKRGVPIVENEGSVIWCHSNGGVLGELRYTDVEGNFVATDISLLASHLLKDVKDMAIKSAVASSDGNLQAIVRHDGQARLVTLLREQEVTGYARLTSDGLFRAVACNGRNELSFILERPSGRRLERLEDGLLLDEAQSFSLVPASQVISGLGRFDGRSVWVVGDGNVFGPFAVSAGVVTLPVAVSSATVGTWKPPVATTLPPPRDIGPNTVLKRRARIHTVHLSLSDTTSVAIATNDGVLRDIDLMRYGLTADVAELDQGFTGTIKIAGLRGYADDPTITISQVRPGRLTVRSITTETAL